jgi:hypothetical protein
MSLSHWSRPLLAVALVLGGCKSNPSAPEAGASAAPAPGKAPAPAPTPAASGPALSYLKPVGSRRCEWVRQPLPSGEPTGFTFEGACDESLLSWSPAGTEGLVFNFMVHEGPRPRAWRVDFATNRGEPLKLEGLPGRAEGGDSEKTVLRRVALDAQGRPVALLSAEGPPGLALAYRLEGTDWKRIETKVGSSGSESPGIDVLDAAQALPVQTLFLFGDPPGQEASAEAARRLDTALPGQEPSGKWMSLSTPGGKLHYRSMMDPDDETFFPSAPVRWEQDGQLVEVKGLTARPGDRLGFQLRRGLLLIYVLAEETRSAHVYDPRTKQRLVFVKDIDSATLWPEPSRP